MKKIVFLPILACLAILFFISSGTVSCTKTNLKIDTVTVIKTDTLIKVDTLKEKDTLITAAILSANPWKVREDRANVGGQFQYYLRGGANNTMSLDNEYITFKSDNTGTYTADNGGVTTFTWQFTDATNRTLVWHWNLPTPVTVTWENVSYDDGALRYSEYYTMGGTNVLSAEIRIPK
jgi:hypothetical protein